MSFNSGGVVLNNTGTLNVAGQSTAIENGRLSGEQLTFSAAGAEYMAKVSGEVIEGIRKSADGQSHWTASRIR